VACLESEVCGLSGVEVSPGERDSAGLKIVPSNNDEYGCLCKFDYGMSEWTIWICKQWCQSEVKSSPMEMRRKRGTSKKLVSTYESSNMANVIALSGRPVDKMHD
jgi:hypothetical protein